MKAVNFIEAVNSGKRFRRSSDSNWLYILNGSVMIRGRAANICSMVDFINYEFELEEEKIEITESEFDYVCLKYRSIYPARCGAFRDYLKKELGF